MPKISKQELDKRFLGELSLIEKKMSFDKETTYAINVIKQNIKQKSMRGGGKQIERPQITDSSVEQKTSKITAIVTACVGLVAAYLTLYGYVDYQRSIRIILSVSEISLKSKLTDILIMTLEKHLPLFTLLGVSVRSIKRCVSEINNLLLLERIKANEIKAIESDDKQTEQEEILKEQISIADKSARDNDEAKKTKNKREIELIERRIQGAEILIAQIVAKQKREREEIELKKQAKKAEAILLFTQMEEDREEKIKLQLQEELVKTIEESAQLQQSNETLVELQNEIENKIELDKENEQNEDIKHHIIENPPKPKSTKKKADPKPKSTRKKAEPKPKEKPKQKPEPKPKSTRKKAEPKLKPEPKLKSEPKLKPEPKQKSTRKKSEPKPKPTRKKAEPKQKIITSKLS